MDKHIRKLKNKDKIYKVKKYYLDEKSSKLSNCKE